jgi:hypothetical protein
MPSSLIEPMPNPIKHHRSEACIRCGFIQISPDISGCMVTITAIILFQVLEETLTHLSLSAAYLDPQNLSPSKG